MKKIELLAPAGNMESLIAAVKAGADAVYLGGTCFSARAFAGNFSHEELIEAITYCHIRGVKVYVTMNTIIYEEEIENAMKEVAFLYDNDVDAILVQDFGLFDRIHHEYPDLELHASTQMHTHNVNGCKFLKGEGFKRVVLARETPIEIVKQCCDAGVEIEVFAYGAICISYSGQCLFSQATQNRSGNRGMCAQCCRMKYKGIKNNEVVTESKNEYLLSPKDLNVINHIPELIDAGVASLKIEGRMKRKEYVYLVTKTFREAIDAYYEHKKYQVSPQRNYELSVMFNRGFSNGHLFHEKVNDRMSTYRPNHLGTPLGKVVSVNKQYVEIKLFDNLYQNDGLRILDSHNDIGILATKIEQDGLLVNFAKKGSNVFVTYPKNQRPKTGASVLKTTDTHLIDQIEQQLRDATRRIDVKVEYQAKLNEPLILKVIDVDGNTVVSKSNFILEPAKKAPLTQTSLCDKIDKINDLPYRITEIEGELDPCFMPVSIINETRRDLFEQLNSIRAKNHIRMGHKSWKDKLSLKDSELPKTIIDQRQGDKEISDDIWKLSNTTSAIDENENDRTCLSHEIIRENGNLYHQLDHCIVGMTMNVSNSYGLAYMYKINGIDGVIFSSEVSNEQIKRSLSAFESRYGFVLPTYRFVQGRRALMSIKDNFTSEKIDAIQELHGDIYPIVHHEEYVEILENKDVKEDNPYCFGSYIIK